MQSAAKVPILVAFEVERSPDGHAIATTVSRRARASNQLRDSEDGGGHEGGGADGKQRRQRPTAAQPAAPPRRPERLAAIFKVGDDIRQDVLAMQVIGLLHGAFRRAGLPLYLRPYGCLPTGHECGVIECVPDTRSRAALGELSDRGLHDIFCAEFGAPGSAAFEAARRNFVVSEAAYAVASFLLQARARDSGGGLCFVNGILGWEASALE